MLENDFSKGIEYIKTLKELKDGSIQFTCLKCKKISITSKKLYELNQEILGSSDYYLNGFIITIFCPECNYENKTAIKHEIITS